MAIIYSITSTKGDKVYIGSTVQPLYKRKSVHKQMLTCSSKELFDEYGFENCVFTVLEECEVDQKLIREKHYITITPNTVNKVMPHRTPDEKVALRKERYRENWDKCKEYREANKERLHMYDKEYQAKNRERELQRKRDWYYANKAKKLNLTQQ